MVGNKALRDPKFWIFSGKVPRSQEREKCLKKNNRLAFFPEGHRVGEPPSFGYPGAGWLPRCWAAALKLVVRSPPKPFQGSWRELACRNLGARLRLSPAAREEDTFLRRDLIPTLDARWVQQVSPVHCEAEDPCQEPIRHGTYGCEPFFFRTSWHKL